MSGQMVILGVDSKTGKQPVTIGSRRFETFTECLDYLGTLETRIQCEMLETVRAAIEGIHDVLGDHTVELTDNTKEDR